MGMGIGPDPSPEGTVLTDRFVEFGCVSWKRQERRLVEARRHGRDQVLLKEVVVSGHPGKFLLDQLDEALRLHLADQNLDARLVDVVTPAERVVDAQDRLDVAQQITNR